MWICWFGENFYGVEELGGKGASLSKMAAHGLPVPPGFVVKASAFRHFMNVSGLITPVKEKVSNLDPYNNTALTEVSTNIRESIKENPVPREICEAVEEAYKKLGSGEELVAVRSSATIEDAKEASFAGQHATYLFVSGVSNVIDKLKECWASLYNPRAIFYRRSKGIPEEQAVIAVVIQKMVNSEKSGVMFTVNPITKNRQEIVIEAVWGQGEGIVSGMITPDNYVVDRESLNLVSKFVAFKEVMMVPDPVAGGVREVEVTPEIAEAQVLDGEELKGLVELGKRVENFFGFPQDVEWATEGGRIYLLQSRPITTL